MGQIWNFLKFIMYWKLVLKRPIWCQSWPTLSPNRSPLLVFNYLKRTAAIGIVITQLEVSVCTQPWLQNACFVFFGCDVLTIENIYKITSIIVLTSVRHTTCHSLFCKSSNNTYIFADYLYIFKIKHTNSENNDILMLNLKRAKKLL